MDLFNQIQEAKKFIESKTQVKPEVVLLLGTGMGSVGEELTIENKIPYAQIPHFAKTTVESHSGTMLLGQWNGVGVMILQGRFHVYEGYTPQEVTFPVRVAHALGAKQLVISGAVGGLNPLYKEGDLVIIRDHINLMGVNPLVGPNDDRLGPRFPDMSEPYSRNLIQTIRNLALQEKIVAHEAVYVGVTGPCLETAAEYRFLRMIGADVVGMSTVPETIVAIHMGMQVMALSCVTDVCLPDALKPAHLETIIKVAGEAEPKVNRLLSEWLRLRK